MGNKIMKLKIFGLLLISILAISAVGTASPYGHGDIREHELGYLSSSQGLQWLYFTNDPYLPVNHNFWSGIKKTDGLTRSYYDITKNQHINHNWDASLNSLHVFRFWFAEEYGTDTHSMTINGIDYNKGLFVAANTHCYKQWAVVYYYDTDSVARTITLTYNP
jgi:hypothetical protein